MSNETLGLTVAVQEYCRRVALREPEVLARLREETRQLPMARMQIAPEQGQLMGLLVELVGARRALEVGVFTGYSAISVALCLPADGRLVACDVNPEWTAIARRYFREAGVEGRIDLRLAPAVETLQTLLRDGQAGTFDFAFIDADKESYDAYYEQCLQLLRPGGLIAIDNVLWGGRVADPAENDPETSAIRALTTKVANDQRVSTSLVPIADGVLLARKR